MAKKVRASYPSPISMGEGHAQPRTVDGIDTDKVADRQGYQRQFGARINQHTDWRNSKTGTRMEEPEYAEDWD